MRRILYIFLCALPIVEIRATSFHFLPKDTYFRVEIREKDYPVKIEKKLANKKLEILGVPTNIDFPQNEFFTGIFLEKEKKIEITLSDDVKTFYFTRPSGEAIVLDFWKEKSTIPSESQEKIKESNQKPIANKKKEKKTEVRVSVENKKRETASFLEPKAELKVESKVEQKDYDLRYQLSYIWDYPAYSPVAAQLVDTKQKYIDFLYPPSFLEASEEEKKYLDLIELYFKKRSYDSVFGVIEQFYKKYPQTKQRARLDYLILCIRWREGKKDKRTFDLMEDLFYKSRYYPIEKALGYFLLEKYKQEKDFPSVLKIAKKLYFSAKQDFDYESSSLIIEQILYAQSSLRLYEEIQEVLNDPLIAKKIPAGSILNYKIYALVASGKEEKAIKEFEKNLEMFNVNVIPKGEVFFNVGESLFRKGLFEKSIVAFDQFLEKNQIGIFSDRARLRIALATMILEDLKEKSFEKVSFLLKNAVNKNVDYETLVEAKIRFFSYHYFRKNPDSTNRDFYFDLDPSKEISENLKNFLMISRMRFFLHKGKYEEGFLYYSKIPLSSLSKHLKSILNYDYSEIVLGYLYTFFEKESYKKIIPMVEKLPKEIKNILNEDKRFLLLMGNNYQKIGIYHESQKIIEKVATLTNKEEKYPFVVKMPNEDVFDLVVKNFLSQEKFTQAQEYLKNYPKKKELYDLEILFLQKKYSLVESKVEENIIENKKQEKQICYYLESLYYQNKIEKFSQMIEASMKDLKTIERNHCFERSFYLAIELEKNKKSKNSLELIRTFEETYHSSKYLSRVTYAKGLILLKEENGKNKKEGREILGSLLKDEKTPLYLKNNIKSDLAYDRISQKQKGQEAL